MDKYEFMRQSKTYERVIEHRHICSKWKSGERCIECFGGGLSKFLDDLTKEGLIKRFDKLIKKWV